MDLDNSPHELTATEMFDMLLRGKKVGQIAQCSNDPELVKLLNYLNVIKHRSRKIYENLGLEWSNSIIICTPKLSEATHGEMVIIELTLPKLPKKYASFLIMDNDESNFTSKNNNSI
jgi:hypothetical protein